MKGNDESYLMTGIAYKPHVAVTAARNGTTKYIKKGWASKMNDKDVKELCLMMGVRNTECHGCLAEKNTEFLLGI